MSYSDLDNLIAPPYEAEGFFSNPELDSVTATRAAMQWVDAYREFGGIEPIKASSRDALRQYKQWADSKGIEPFGAQQYVETAIREERFSQNLPHWKELFSDEGFEGEMKRRGLLEKYQGLVDQIGDEDALKAQMRRRILLRDLRGADNTRDQAIVANMIGATDPTDEGFLSQAKSWIETSYAKQQSIKEAQASAWDAFLSRDEEQLAQAREAAKTKGKEELSGFLRTSEAISKEYGKIIPLAKQMVSYIKAREERGLFEEENLPDLNFPAIIRLYKDGKREDFLGVVGEVAKREQVRLDGSIYRGIKSGGRTLDSILGGMTRFINANRTDGEERKESIQVREDLQNLSNAIVDIQAKGWGEKMFQGSLNSIVYMGVAGAGLTGFATIATSKTQEVAEGMRRKKPELSQNEAYLAAAPAGIAYAGVEKMQLLGMFGKIPGMNRLGTSLVARTAGLGAFEYSQEIFQNSLEPMVNDLANGLSQKYPEGDWSKFKLWDPDVALALAPLIMVGGISQTAVAREFEFQQLQAITSDTRTLKLYGLDEAEVAEASRLSESDPMEALNYIKAQAAARPMEKRQEISRKAVAEEAERIRLEELAEVPTSSRDKDGNTVIDFKDGRVETFETEAEANESLNRWMAEEIIDTSSALSEFADYVQKKSEGDNEVEIGEPRKLSELARKGVETEATLKKAVQVFYAQMGQSAPDRVNLADYTEGGSVLLRNELGDYSVRLAKGASPLTVAEEFSEGFLKRSVKLGETTFGEVRDLLDEFGEIAGIKMTEGAEKDPTRAVIEGFSKFTKAYLLQGNYSALPEKSRNWFQKAWDIMENRENLNPILRSFVEMLGDMFKVVYDVAKAIEFQRKDGDGINPELEALAKRALGLNEEAVAQKMEEAYKKEVQEDLGIDGETTFSITPAQDAEYLSAVESGDMDKAQEMVEEAAKKAGYNIGPVWHSTDAKIDVFDPNKGSRGMVYFATSPQAANAGQLGGTKRKVRAFLKSKNPYNSEKDPLYFGDAEAFKVGKIPVSDQTLRYAAESFLEYDPQISSEELASEISKAYPDEDIADIQASIASVVGIPAPKRSVENVLNATGSDLVFVSDESGTSLAVKSPNQIKSADPVTYDDQGNVIPLSERFNERDDRITFSLDETSKREEILEAVDVPIVINKLEGNIEKDAEAWRNSREENAQERRDIATRIIARAQAYKDNLPAYPFGPVVAKAEDLAEQILEDVVLEAEGIRIKDEEGFYTGVKFKLPGFLERFSLMRFLQRNLTARGNLTAEQFRIKLAAEATSLSELKRAELVNRRLRKAVKEEAKTYPKNGVLVDDVLMRQVQDALVMENAEEVTDAINQLPESLQGVAKEMRKHVDSLSRKMIEVGIAKGELEEVFKRNLGSYLNRSYRRFVRPDKWQHEVSQEAKDNAKKWLYDNLPTEAFDGDITVDEQLDGWVESLLTDSVEGGFTDQLNWLLGQKYMGNLIARKKVPAELRELFGEYKRADENYLTTIRKMAKQIGNHTMLEEFKKEGHGTHIFDTPRGRFTHQITAAGNDSLSPLDGYYVSEEMAEALKDFTEMDQKTVDGWLKYWLKFNSVAKVTKTIYNPTTHARNFLSNFLYTGANGNLLSYVRFSKDSAKLNMREVFKGIKTDKDMEDRIVHYVRLGIMQQGAVSQEFKDILKDFASQDVDIEEYSQGKLKKLWNATTGTIQGAYQAEDDFHKVVAFEAERAKLKKAKSSWDDQKLDAEAAQIVRNTMPDYSQVPKLVRMLRRFPLVGTFTSFTSEVLRNNVNIIERSVTEMKDKDLKAVGVQRMSSLMFFHALPLMAAYYLKQLFGVDDEEDEATRALAAPWDKYSQLLYTGRTPSGDPTYINISYTDPFSIFKSPFLVSQKDGWSAKSVGKGLVMGLEPFYGRELGTKGLMEIANNQKDNGGEIYNPNADVFAQVRDIGKHLVDTVEPGIFRSAGRIERAFSGKENNSGVKLDPATEVIAVLTGQRVSTVDRKTQVRYANMDFERAGRRATTRFNKVWRSRSSTQNEIEKAYSQLLEDRKKAYKDWQDTLKAASRLGLSEEDILLEVTEGKTHTKTAMTTLALLRAGNEDTPIPKKVFSKAQIEEIKEIEGREEILKKVAPSLFPK